MSRVSRPEYIAAVREFNRFYTARLGLLRKRHLDGEFSLTEARVLYEIGAAPNVTASTLHNTLDLDPGYLSRLLAMMMRRKLVRHKTSRADGREKLLSLNGVGPETADSILLYAGNHPVFVVDAYTRRIVERHECQIPCHPNLRRRRRRSLLPVAGRLYRRRPLQRIGNSRLSFGPDTNSSCGAARCLLS